VSDGCDGRHFAIGGHSYRELSICSGGRGIAIADRSGNNGLMDKLLQWLGGKEIIAKLTEFGIVTIACVGILGWVIVKVAPHVKEYHIKRVETKEKYKTHRAKLEAKMESRRLQAAQRGPQIHPTKGKGQ
jgi:hypothetical protein